MPPTGASVPFATALRDTRRAMLACFAPESQAAEAARPSLSLRSCPLATAFNRIRGRRRLLLTWHLFWGPKAFAELAQLSAGVKQRALRQELQALEASGLVERQPGPHRDGPLEYRLTPLGEALKPALAALYLWGLEVQRSCLPGRLGAPLADATD